MAEVAAVKEPIVFTLRTELHGSHAWVTVFARGAHAGVLRLRPEEVEPFRTRLVAVPGYDSEEQRIWQGANAWQADRIAELERELTATRALMALAKEALLEGSLVKDFNVLYRAAEAAGTQAMLDGYHTAHMRDLARQLVRLRPAFFMTVSARLAASGPVAPGGWGPNDVPAPKAGEGD